ncbi:MAG TPA: VWA domain-containing protein [Blastocatellia bacterium]|nr:VWA domain-containing protein [Blastocatellia bacterium]
MFAAPNYAQAPSQTGDQSLKLSAKEVLLDVIARDKKGRNVRDLKPEDIEVYEDGVRQSLTSFRLIETPVAATNAHPTSFPVDPARPVNLVTMVFDNLDNSSRKLAREAALDFVNTGMHQNVMVSVYTVGNRFYVLQSFTADKDKVRQAIELATNRAETQYANVSRKMVEQMEIIANAADFGPGPNAPAAAQASVIATTNSAVPTMPIGIAPTSAGIGGTGFDKAVAQITLNTLRAVEAAMVEQQARSSLYTFLHVVREQKRLLGRKTLLYFSTGLTVPPNLVDLLRTTMSEANRANVSIYAIDARGLQIDNESERAKAQLAMAIGASSAAYNEGGSLSALAGSFKSAETAESSIRQNKQGTLAELAEGTGGQLIANTNDLRKPIRQVAEDISSYYALSYAPTVQELDGKFRKLTIKLARPDVKVISRSGYFAVPTVDGKAVMGYEMPLLAALNEATPKRDFTYRMGVLRFAPSAPDVNKAAQHLLLLSVPLAELSFQSDKVKKLYSTHFSVLGLIKNEKGEVVARVSQDYPLQGKLERLESLKKGHLDFTKAFALAPGNYYLQTVVYDFDSGKTSVQSRPLLVPAPQPALALSSLTFIRKLDSAGLNKPGDDKPLATTIGRIIPNLGETVDAAREKILGFYVVAYTNNKDKATLTLEFLQSGEVVAQITMDLPAPDDKGRIAHVFSVPADSFSSGEYQARAVVRQGTAQVVESTSLTILNLNPTRKEAPKAQAMAAAATTEIAAPVAPAAPPISTVGMSAAVLAVTKALPSQSTNAAAINIPDLLSEVEKNGSALFQSLLGFTYQLRKVHHILNDTGEPTKEEFQDYEAYPVRGRHVLIKIADHGKKLADWEVEQERKRAGGELERAESDTKSAAPSYLTAAVSGSHRGKAAGLLIDPATFLRACDFVDPRTETLDGREMIVLDFLPRLGEKLPPTKAFVNNLTGTIWIDAADKVLVRLEAKNLIPGTDKNGKPLRVSPEPKLVYQQAKQPSGEWFPSVIRLNADGDASAFFGLNWDVVFEFRDYKRFDTGSEKEKIITPTKP